MTTRTDAQSQTILAAFACHGIWGPGVRTFRQLTFPLGAACITLAFLVPTVLLGGFYVRARLDSIHASALESKGVAYVEGANELLREAEHLQSRALQEATKPTGGVAADRQALDKQLAQMQAVDVALGAQLGTTAALTKVREALEGVAAPSDGLMKVYATHVRLMLSIRDLIGAAADGSGLTLDPDLDTYHLMDSVVLKLPQVIEQLARTRSLAAAVAIAGQGGEIAAVELNRLDAMTEDLAQQAAAGMSKVIAVHPSAKPILDLAPAIALADVLRDDATDAPGTGGLARAAKLQLEGDHVVTAMRHTQTAALHDLDELLAARKLRNERSLAMVAAAVAVALVIAAYLFQSFYIVMRGGLNEVRKHLEQMAAGDLTQSPQPWGRDEAAQLMMALRSAQGTVREIVLGVRDVAENIVSAIQQISHGADDMSTRTENAAASLQQTSSSMTEISGTVARTTEVANEATQLAHENSAVASEGGQIIGKMVSTMNEINTSSRRIADIIGTIDGIAFQTNILALNAAVEAARAGEQGRGFAVVASEVRSLAQRASAAAREIKSLIGESVTKVEAGTTVVRRAGDTMSRIVANADRIREALDIIASGARKQQQGLGEIGSAVKQLDDSTQQNAALSEQTASASSSLESQARGLVEQVARFRLPQCA